MHAQINIVDYKMNNLWKEIYYQNFNATIFFTKEEDVTGRRNKMVSVELHYDSLGNITHMILTDENNIYQVEEQITPDNDKAPESFINRSQRVNDTSTMTFLLFNPQKRD